MISFSMAGPPANNTVASAISSSGTGAGLMSTSQTGVTPSTSAAASNTNRPGTLQPGGGPLPPMGGSGAPTVITAISKGTTPAPAPIALQPLPVSTPPPVVSNITASSSQPPAMSTMSGTGSYYNDDVATATPITGDLATPFDWKKYIPHIIGGLIVIGAIAYFVMKDKSK